MKVIADSDAEGRGRGANGCITLAMTGTAKLSTTLFLTLIAAAGCSESPSYSGGAMLEPVVYRAPANARVTGDASSSATQLVRNAAELTGPDDDWKVRSRFDGPASGHTRLEQVHRGVRVWGADVVAHSKGAAFDFVAGNRVAGLAGFDVTPGIKAEAALVTARGDYGKRAAAGTNMTGKTALEFSREETELVIFPQPGGETRLAWHVTFFTELQAGIAPGLWNYFIDAEDGSLLTSWNGIHTAIAEASGPGGNAKVERTWTDALDVRRISGVYAMDTERLQTYDLANGTSGGTIVTGTLDNFGDAAINDAHGFAEVTLNMLADWQGFNSIDNNGFVIKSRVHYSSNYENAFWDGTQMTYGDGASTFYPLSGDVDVVAHEINHGFTTFHSDLIYSGQSGGLNESFSDIAGTVAEFFDEGDAADWDLGTDIFRGNAALRFMCDPPQDGASIDNFADYNDGIDVHYSSGISNKAFCLTARRFASGSPTGDATQDSVKRASLAWYRANAGFWTTSTTFAQGCQGTLDAAAELAFTADEITALQQSWADVGVTCAPQ